MARSTSGWDNVAITIPFSNRYGRLPESFYQSVAPTPPASPKIRIWNEELAKFLGIKGSFKDCRIDLERVFSGSLIASNSKPLAMAYAGHQFGGFSSILGDGRAHLLGELKGQDGVTYDVQLKGSGRTRFSRGGDGRSPLGPVVREYLVSEAMHFLGVPTTRSLAIVESGELVYRDQAFPGGILTRVAQSHIRIGHFEYFAQRNDASSLSALIRFLIERSYPDLSSDEDQPVVLFDAIVKRQANLVAKWMSFGFVHGVMNTDNTSASGITIDYGPCAFLDEADFTKVFSSIDQHGRYAYDKQPTILQWNLARLAESLLAAYPAEEAKQKVVEFEKILEGFAEKFNERWQSLFLRKIGITDGADKTSLDILKRWLTHFQVNKIDFTLGFRSLADLALDKACVLTDHHDGQLKGLKDDWKQQLHSTGEIGEAVRLMNSANPYLIPRNHVIERIIQSCYSGDFTEFDHLVEELKTPFSYSESKKSFFAPPRSGEEVTQTFCGT